MSSKNHPQTPWPVTIQAALVLFFTTSNFIRLGGSLVHWEALNEFGAPALYLALSGLAWGILGSLLFWLIWRAKKIAAGAGILLTSLYTLFQWFDKFAIQETPLQNAPFLLAVSIIPILLFLLPFWLEEGQAYYTKELK